MCEAEAAVAAMASRLEEAENKVKRMEDLERRFEEAEREVASLRSELQTLRSDGGAGAQGESVVSSVTGPGASSNIDEASSKLLHVME